MQRHNPDQIEMEEASFVKGTVTAVIYHNETNLYTVLKVKVEETSESFEDKTVSVTGYFPLIHEDDIYTFYGKTASHPKFGLQFQADHFKKEVPTTKEGVIQYLASDLFEGIGKKTAEEIVNKLGEGAINKILSDGAVLYDVPKLSKKKADKLAAALQQHQGLEQIMISLSEFGFGPQLSMKIYQAYEAETLDKIRENPYQLVKDVEGIGFIKADELGGRMGISGFWVLFSITVFGSVFSFPGMLVGVPVFTVIYALCAEAINNSLQKKNLPLPNPPWRSSRLW